MVRRRTARSRQGRGIIGLGRSKAVPIPQFTADRFFLLMQRQRLLQPSPRLQDQRLVPQPRLQLSPVLFFLRSMAHLLADLISFSWTTDARSQAIAAVGECIRRSLPLF